MDTAPLTEKGGSIKTVSPDFGSGNVSRQEISEWLQTNAEPLKQALKGTAVAVAGTQDSPHKSLISVTRKDPSGEELRVSLNLSSYYKENPQGTWRVSHSLGQDRGFRTIEDGYFQRVTAEPDMGLILNGEDEYRTVVYQIKPNGEVIMTTTPKVQSPTLKE